MSLSTEVRNRPGHPIVAAIRGANSRTASFLGPPSDHLRLGETSREESQRPSSHAEQDVPIQCGLRHGWFNSRSIDLLGMRASPLTSPATWAFVIARYVCITSVAQSPGSQSAKGGYPGTRTTRWEAGGDGTRSTLLPLWEWLDSSEADTMPRCHPANPASGSEEGELCAFSSIRYGL